MKCYKFVTYHSNLYPHPLYSTLYREILGNYQEKFWHTRESNRVKVYVLRVWAERSILRPFLLLAVWNSTDIYAVLNQKKPVELVSVLLNPFVNIRLR